MKTIEQHEEDLDKLNTLEYLVIKVLPFIVSISIIYWLAKNVC